MRPYRDAELVVVTTNTRVKAPAYYHGALRAPKPYEAIEPSLWGDFPTR